MEITAQCVKILKSYKVQHDDVAQLLADAVVAIMKLQVPKMTSKEVQSLAAQCYKLFALKATPVGDSMEMEEEQPEEEDQPEKEEEEEEEEVEQEEEDKPDKKTKTKKAKQPAKKKKKRTPEEFQQWYNEREIIPEAPSIPAIINPTQLQCKEDFSKEMSNATKLLEKNKIYTQYSKAVKKRIKNMAKVNLALCWVEMKKKFKKNAYAVLKEINAQNGNSRFLKKETLEKTKSILLFFNDELVRFVLESGLEGPYYFIAMTNKKAFIDEIRQYKLQQMGDIEEEEHAHTNVHNKRQRAHKNGTMSAKKYKNGVTFEEDNDEEEDRRNIEEEDDDEEEENEDEDDEYSDDNDEYEDDDDEEEEEDDDDDDDDKEEEEDDDENEEEGVGANSSDLDKMEVVKSKNGVKYRDNHVHDNIKRGNGEKNRHCKQNGIKRN